MALGEKSSLVGTEKESPIGGFVSNLYGLLSTLGDDRSLFQKFSRSKSKAKAAIAETGSAALITTRLTSSLPPTHK